MFLSRELFGDFFYIAVFFCVFIYRINSEFNTKVVDCIVQGIGTEEYNKNFMHVYVLDYFLSEGVTAHRKTLVAKGKSTESPIKRKKRQRSRKQRVSYLLVNAAT